MQSISYRIEPDVSFDEVFPFYQDAGWSAYTDEPDTLKAALNHSLNIITARDEKGQLIGFTRLVGDGYTILYIHDIIVLNKYQRKGIGKKMIQKVLDRYPFVRQKVLLTDQSPKTKAFYESLGFEACEGNPLIAYYHKG